MIFNTWTFAAFASVALTVYWTVVPARLRPHALVASGALFYAYAVPAYLLLVAVLAAITYAASAAMTRVARVRRKPMLVIAVATIVAALAFFKYSLFVASIVDTLARRTLVPLPAIVVPLAISFFTFEFIHVLVDAYDDKIDRLDPLDFAAFTLFFPTLVAGPIKRYESFVPQLRSLVSPDRRTLGLDVYRIFLGLAKKTIVADSMNVFVAPIRVPGDPFGRPDYIVAVLAYAIEIYFDFSGYSDIAIGVAGLLGIRVPENFAMPYRAANISEFWRRWHISLSAWIRDYVFIPLGGSRRPAPIVALNLLVAMAIAGLWHGAAWTFVAWGLWHGIGLASHRAWATSVVPRVAFLRGGSLAIRLLSIGATFAFVSAGWVLFASTSIGNATLVYRRLFF